MQHIQANPSSWLSRRSCEGRLGYAYQGIPSSLTNDLRLRRRGKTTMASCTWRYCVGTINDGDWLNLKEIGWVCCETFRRTNEQCVIWDASAEGDDASTLEGDTRREQRTKEDTVGECIFHSGQSHVLVIA
ncbi:hypothetical protein CBL_10698 [Carabus blaptoides fortunei]